MLSATHVGVVAPGVKAGPDEIESISGEIDWHTPGAVCSNGGESEG